MRQEVEAARSKPSTSASKLAGIGGIAAGDFSG
jgi:hypothetical protein